MHGNRRYVKLTWIGLLAGLAFASPTRAEVVTRAADEGLLAVAPDGTPRVAYAVGRDLHVARRSGGTWRSNRVARLQSVRAVLTGIVVEPRGIVSVLAEDAGGRWIELVRGRRVLRIARARGANSYGPPGLALDANGRPAVAYGVRLPTGDTYLRLVTIGATDRPRTHGITLKGFPRSDVVPGAAPVLVGGRLHVVETYTSAAIEWAPKAGGGWEGQYLFASRLGTPVGRVGAVVTSGPTLWSAWTQDYPELGDISVLLTSSAETQETFTLTHGVFVSIATAANGPEIGAYDRIAIGDWFDYAGLVIAGPGNEAWQLDGRLDGYAVPPQGGRQLLLSRGHGLEWFEAPPPAPALPAVEIRMAVDPTGNVTGSVVGASGGEVQIYREAPDAPRELIAAASVTGDHSFEALVPAPTSGMVYRAVYLDPATGIPFGFLPGVPVGVSRVVAR